MDLFSACHMLNTDTIYKNIKTKVNITLLNSIESGYEKVNGKIMYW